MGSETLVQGHAFDFETGICTRCGMSEIEFEKQGEPQCTGKKPETQWAVGNPCGTRGRTSEGDVSPHTS
jgi:hypothetical protein